MMRPALPTLARVTTVVVRVSAPANITLSGLQTLDGITLVTNDLVLVNNQTDATQNGVYVASATAWRKLGKVKCVLVSLGTQFADSLFFLATSPANTYLQLQTGGGNVVVKAATTAAITLSGPQTIDGISVSAGDKVLVKNNTGVNGVYIVAAGAWTKVGIPTSVSVSSGTISGSLQYFLSQPDVYFPQVGVYG